MQEISIEKAKQLYYSGITIYIIPVKNKEKKFKLNMLNCCEDTDPLTFSRQFMIELEKVKKKYKKLKFFVSEKDLEILEMCEYMC